MKALLRVSFFALAILAGISVSAQSARSSSYGFSGEEGALSFGLKTGFNFSGFTGKGADDILDTDTKTGYGFGLFMEYGMPSNLYFLTGLDFVIKGGQWTEKDGSIKEKETYSPVYVQLPLHAGYKIAVADEMTVGIHAGPYLAYGLGGKIKYEYKDSDYPEDNEKGDDDFFGSEKEGGFKSFDFGLGIGADLDISKFRVGLGYDLGLSNIGRNKDYPVKNRNFFINVGYKF